MPALLFATGDAGDALLKVEKCEAFRGAGNRVFLSEKDALVDVAIAHLARRFLSKVGDRQGHGTFAYLMEIASVDPGLFEAIARLVVFRDGKEQS